jgi:hypothetical protein
MTKLLWSQNHSFQIPLSPHTRLGFLKKISLIRIKKSPFSQWRKSKARLTLLLYRATL